MSIEIMTMEVALTKGWTHFVEEEGERVIPFSRITEENRQYYKTGKYFLVNMKESIHYSFSAEEIKQIIVDHVTEQDTVADEEGKLADICAAHDYNQLANDLNQKFEAHKFYEPTEILVTF